MSTQNLKQTKQVLIVEIIMNKTRLRVVFAKNPPDIYADCRKFPTLVPSFECPFPGWTAEIIGMIADSLHWEIEPIIMPLPPSNPQVSINGGSFDNTTNSWTGLLGYIDRNEADTLCLTYEYLETRDVYFDYSYPIFNVKVMYIAKRKGTNILSALWNSFSPFPYDVWLIILAFLIIQATYATMVRYLEWKIGYEQIFYPFEKYWQYLKFFLLQPEETKAFKSAAGVLVFAIFLVLQVLVFTNLYKVSVISALLKSPDLLPFHSSVEMIQLIAAGQYKMITHQLNYAGNWYFSDLKESNDPHFVLLRQALRKNPLFIVENASVALGYLKTGGYIYPSQQDSNLIPFIQGQCDLYYFSADTPQKSAYFIFPNGSELVKQWNRGIIMNIDYIAHTFSKYFESGLIGPPYPRCSDLDTIPDAYKPLDISSTFGVFLITLMCSIISSIGLLIEVYFHWNTNLIKNTHSQEKTLVHSIFSLLETIFGAHQTVIRKLTNSMTNFNINDTKQGKIFASGIPTSNENYKNESMCV